MARDRRKDLRPEERPDGLTHNPFAKMLGGSPEAAPKTPPADSDSAPGPETPGGKVVVRREKKGRGGKTVTRVEGPGLDGRDLGGLAKQLKRALGCGANVDDGGIVVQGAQTDRAAAWLEKELGLDVTIGN